MKNKDIEKLLKVEGDKMMSSSFAAIKDKLPQDEEVIVSSINKEGEEFVPNNYPPIKDNVLELSKDKPAKKRGFPLSLKIGLSTVAATAVTCAIVIPVVNWSNRLLLNAEASCDVSLSNSSGESLELACDIDRNGNVKENTLEASNETAKKTLAGMKAKSTKVSDKYVDTYVIDIAKFAFETDDKTSNKILDKAKEYTLKVYLTGAGASDASYIKRLKSSLETNILKKLNSVNKINVNVFGDPDVTGDKDKDTLSARKYRLNQLINKLFADNNTIIDGFNPNSFFNDESLENINNQIKYLQDIYNHLPNDSLISSFQDDLTVINSIYTSRLDSLKKAIEECETAIGIKKDEGYQIDTSLNYSPFNINALPSSSWWNNQCDVDINNPGFDLYDFYSDELPTDDITYVSTVAQKKLTSINHIFDKDINPTSYLVEIHNFLCEMIKNNNEWFSLAFDLIKVKNQIKDNNGDNVTWSATSYWDETENYWSNYWTK